MKAARALLLLAVCVVALAAAAGPAAAAPSNRLLQAADGEPKKAIKPADQALARAAVVTKADLGAGWVIDNSGNSTPDPDVKCPGYDPDESHLTLTGDVEGNTLRFVKAPTILFVSSYANVYKSPAQANESWRLGAKPALWACAGKQLEATSDKDTTIRVRSATSSTVPAAAAYKRLGGRVVGDVTYKSNGQTIRFYMDIVVLQRGRVQSLVFLLSFGAPAASSDRLALTGILAAKLRAAEKRDAPPLTA